MKRIRLGLVLIFGGMVAGAAPAAVVSAAVVSAAVVSAAVASGAVASAAVASAATAVPQAGDWEGTGPHGLPLSFELERHGGRLVATSLAVGYPGSCPAVARNAEGVPLGRPSYAGPGGAAGTGVAGSASPAVLEGQVPGSAQRVSLSGRFSTRRTGRFSIQDSKPLGCGWPQKTLTWNVHRVVRLRVDDGTWAGPLTATGLINGNVRLVVGAQGRVIDSFTSFFTCVANYQQGNTTFRAVPAFEFVRPSGAFYSPLNGGSVSHHPTTWSGRFSASRGVTGSLRIFDNCTRAMITARFTARRTKPAR